MTADENKTDKAIKKRRRPALACEQCRARKIRCDRGSPCHHCVKANIPSCTYAPTHIPASRSKKSAALNKAAAKTVPQSPGTTFLPLRPAASLTSPESIEQEYIRPRTTISRVYESSGTPSSSAGAKSNASSVEWLMSRVNQLEEKLASIARIEESGQTRKETAWFHTHVPIAKGTVSKTRYFGQSHWSNGIELFALEIDLLQRAETNKSEDYLLLEKCKALARKIKENRCRPVASDNLGNERPSREVADQLIEAYLRTFEGVIRILHVPTFRTEYERYWQKPDAASVPFIMQMQLCMALGAVFYDKTFSLRSMAAQWIQEAQLWLVMPPEKGRMTLAGLQIMCLLILAKSACAVGQDSTWITTGSLVRKAMYMGLHRDPKHLARMTTYRAEMRRRLWASVLELNLQASFEAGGPPFMSSADYDTQPPANLDDEQLSDEPDSEVPHGQADDIPTQTSTQIALLRTMPLRLRLLRYVNDFQSNDSYDETLRLNSELTKAAQSLTQTMLGFASKDERRQNSSAYAFRLSLAEMFVYRCFHALHQPVVLRSVSDPKFYFSRKMFVESSLKLAQIYELVRHRKDAESSTASMTGGDCTSWEEKSDFKRLTLNGAGMFRNGAVQALFMIGSELIHNRNNNTTDMSLSYHPSAMEDFDLKGCLRAAAEWTLERLRAGETNPKGYCFMSCSLAHIEALEIGATQEDTEKAIISTMRVAVSRCWEALLEVSRREGIPDQPGEEIDGLQYQEEVLNVMTDWMGDWEWDEMDGLSWTPWSQPVPYDMMQSPLGSGQL